MARLEDERLNVAQVAGVGGPALIFIQDDNERCVCEMNPAPHESYTQADLERAHRFALSGRMQDALEHAQERLAHLENYSDRHDAWDENLIILKEKIDAILEQLPDSRTEG